MSRKKPKKIRYRQFTLFDFPIVVKDPVIKPAKKTRKAKVSVVQDEDGYIEKRPIEPVNPHSCDTCKGGCFDGPVTVTMDCPDYPDVSSGKIDGEKLREDTRRLGCSRWSAPGSETKIPNIAWCCGTRDCKSLDWEGGICIPTGKKIKEMTYCPTQHLAEKPQPEAEKPAKKPRSRKPKNAITDTTCQMAERMHCGPEDRAACEKSGKVGLLGVVCPVPVPCPEKNSMGTCMNGAYSCPELDWEGGICIPTGKKIKEQTYCPTQHLAEKQTLKVRKCCPTCSHHKAKKTFDETCPRKDDLMFNGGHLSATALMLETSLKDCPHWTPKPEPVKKTKKKKEQ